MTDTRKDQVLRINKNYSPKTSDNENKYYRINIMVKTVRQNSTVLDIGCGNGYAMKILSKKGCKCEGIDISKKEAEYARKQGFVVHELDLESRWSDKVNKKYDYVLAGEIIEHIYDTDFFIKNIKKVLKKDGYLIISTPNVATLGRRIMLLLGINPMLETTLRKTDAGHIRYFTFKDLHELLEDHKLNILKKESTYISFSKKGGGHKSRLLAKIFPSFGSTIIIYAQKN